MATFETAGKTGSVFSSSNFAPPLSSVGEKPPIHPPPAKKIQIVEQAPNPSHSTSDSHPSLTPLLLEEVFTLRNKVIGRRLDVQNERQYYFEQRKHTLQAQQTFGDLCTSFVSSCHANTSQPDISSLQDGLRQVHESHRLLEQIDIALQLHETRLNAQEDALRKKETELYDQVAKDRDLAVGSFTLAGDAPSFKNNSVFSYHSGSTPDSAIPEPPIVQDYYDKIGDMGILRERLFNFEAEHQRQIKVREARRDEGKRAVPPDSQFFQNYFNQRLSLVQEYLTTSMEVQNLKLQCREQGHEVEEPNIVPLEGRGALDRIERTESPVRRMDDLIRTNGMQIADMNQSLHISYGNPKLRVIQWLDDVFSSHPPSHTNEGSFLAPSIKYNSEAAPDSPSPDFGLLQEAGPDEVWRGLQPRNRKDRTFRSRTNSLTSLSTFHGDAPARPYSDAFVQIRSELLRETADPALPSSSSAK